MPFTPWVGIDATLTVPVNLQSPTATQAVFGASITGDAFNRAELRANGTIGLGTGGATPGLLITRQAGPAVGINGPLDVNAAGSGLQVAEGSNAKQGTATLSGGTVTVANTSVTASSRIFLTAQTSGAAPGALRVSAVTAGTSFVITSTSGTDTSVVAYEIFEPG